MMEAAIFSSKTPAIVSPLDFAAMQPHLRQELCLLLRERGMRAVQIAAALDCHPADIRCLLSQRHAYRAANVDKVVAHDQDDRLTRAGMAILRLMAAQPQGRLALPRPEIEVLAGLRVGAADFGLRSLDRLGLARRVSTGRGQRASVWEMTAEGRAYLDQLDKVSP